MRCPRLKNGVVVRFLYSLFELSFHQFSSRRQNHVAPYALDTGFDEELFHFILKFLSYELVFQNRDDQDFPELWHGLVGDNPTVNNFCASVIAGWQAK